jgi:Cu/Ag efflux pump CusA
VVDDIQSAVARSAPMPAGYRVEYGGQFESQQQATRLIGWLSLISALLIFAALYGHFRSVRLALQVMATIPLAIIGGVIAIFMSGGTLSVASLVGFITVAGIGTRNSIMMLSHYLHLMAHEGESFGDAMIQRGSLERLVPVLMTALATGLAMLPLAASAGIPGSEILQPVAIVILGGLASVTVLDQLVTPALFARFGASAALRSAAAQAAAAR